VSELGKSENAFLVRSKESSFLILKKMLRDWLNNESESEDLSWEVGSHNRSPGQDIMRIRGKRNLGGGGTYRADRLVRPLRA
jgi:hypothetical protein